MNTEKALLKICVYSDERIDGITLYERITLKAKELGLAGATVIKGISGFIGEDTIHKPRLAALTESLPVTIEIVDSEANINKLLPFLDKFVRNGLVVLQPLTALKK